MKKLTIFVAAALALGACGSKKQAVAEPEAEFDIVKAPERPVIGGETYVLPRAVVYKMNGNYADNVTVQVDAQGRITSYPAPQDVRDMQPVALADGWFLTRRGVSEQTAFTRYTYADYAALPSAPTLPELQASIIPGAKVTELRVLPISQSEAIENPSAIELGD